MEKTTPAHASYDLQNVKEDETFKSGSSLPGSTSTPGPAIALPQQSSATDYTDLLASFSDIAAARSPIAESKLTLAPPLPVSSSGRKTRSDHAAARAAMQVAGLQQTTTQQESGSPQTTSTSSSSIAVLSSSPQPPGPGESSEHEPAVSSSTATKTRRQALQSHTPSHPTQGIAKHIEYDPSTGQNITTTKVYLICRHDCGCKRRGSDLSLLTAPRACSSRGARHDHETNPALHPW